MDETTHIIMSQEGLMYCIGAVLGFVHSHEVPQSQINTMC